MTLVFVLVTYLIHIALVGITGGIDTRRPFYFSGANSKVLIGPQRVVWEADVRDGVLFACIKTRFSSMLLVRVVVANTGLIRSV